MKLILILLASVSAGVASADHFHSFMLGLAVSALAVGSCYWFCFRSTRFPALAVVLLLCGMLSKLAITVSGVMIGVNEGLMTSPLVFSLTYLYFSIVITYLWFSYRQSVTEVPKKLSAAKA